MSFFEVVGAQEEVLTTVVSEVAMAPTPEPVEEWHAAISAD